MTNFNKNPIYLFSIDDLFQIWDIIKLKNSPSKYNKQLQLGHKFKCFKIKEKCSDDVSKIKKMHL